MARAGEPLLVRQYDVANLPAASAVKAGTVALVWDADDYGDVSTGGGSVVGLAQSDGSAWEWLTVSVDSSGNINGGVNSISLTIASDEITLPSHTKPAIWNVLLDTEGGGATDNLQDINGTVVGDRIILRTTAAARDVVLKHVTGGGNLRHFMHGSGDQTLGEAYHYAEYMVRATSNGVDLVNLTN